jgi:hypothetical protein
MPVTVGSGLAQGGVGSGDGGRYGNVRAKSGMQAQVADRHADGLGLWLETDVENDCVVSRRPVECGDTCGDTCRHCVETPG